MRATITLSPRRRKIITVMVAETVPSNALLDDQGRPILDDQGRYILVNQP